MKNIHVLQTYKPSRLWLTKLGNLTRCHDIKPIKKALGNNVNIYITNDEEIKEGDWYINTFVSEREQKPQTHTEKKQLINHHKDYRFKYCKKIILTTDQDLIKDGVQAIDDEFLNWFIDNPTCEEVEVKWIKTPDGIFYHKDNVPYGCYKIIIPKEEPKQEILEEFAERIAKAFDIDNYKPIMELIIEGAKWQQERMYSEEDMKICWQEATEDMRKQFSTSYSGMTFEKFIEHYKK